MNEIIHKVPEDPAKLAEEMTVTLRMVYDVHEIIEAMLFRLNKDEKQGRAASALRVAYSEINTIIIRMDPEVRRLSELEQHSKE